MPWGWTGPHRAGWSGRFCSPAARRDGWWRDPHRSAPHGRRPSASAAGWGWRQRSRRSDHRRGGHRQIAAPPRHNPGCRAHSFGEQQPERPARADLHSQGPARRGTAGSSGHLWCRDLPARRSGAGRIAGHWDHRAGKPAGSWRCSARSWTGDSGHRGCSWRWFQRSRSRHPARRWRWRTVQHAPSGTAPGLRTPCWRRNTRCHSGHRRWRRQRTWRWGRPSRRRPAAAEPGAGRDHQGRWRLSG